MGSPIFISRLKGFIISASDLNSSLSAALGINLYFIYLGRRHDSLESVGQCLRQIPLLGKDLIGKGSLCPLAWQTCKCWNYKLPCVGHALLFASKEGWTWPMALGLICTSVLSSSSAIWKADSSSPTLLFPSVQPLLLPAVDYPLPDLSAEPLTWGGYSLACLSQSQYCSQAQFE